MLNEKFMEVLAQEGVVSIVSWNDGDAHVSNTWNSYLVVADGNRLLIPAAGMRRTQRNVEGNPKVKLTLGSREVMGYNYPGTGFLVEGTAAFITQGEEYDMMYSKYPFLSRVLEVTVLSAKQTL